MKLKRILIVSIFCIAILVSACGTNKMEEHNAVGVVETTEKEVVTESEKNTENVREAEGNLLLSGVFEVPGTTICVDVPDMQTIESGFTEIYFQEDVKYVTFTCVRTESVDDAENALAISINSVINGMSGLHHLNELIEVTGEIVTINDIETYAFEGKFNCGRFEVYDAYVAGYSFIFEDKPCAIIGVVMDVAQPQEQIDAVKELVDAMILTVRSEE